MRLLGVELSRLRSRRATWLIVVVALAGVLLALGSHVIDARPPSASEIAAAQALVDQEMDAPFLRAEVERCEEAHAEGGTDEFPAEFDCAHLLPQIEWFLNYQEPSFVRDLREFLPAAALILALAGALVGATFVGAEWAAGTIGTHLLFEPRRARVFASKAGAVGIGMSLAALLGLAAVYLVTWFTASTWGSTALVTSTFEVQPTGEEFEVEATISWLEVGGFGVRSLAFVAAAALGGYVLAMAFRSSLAAVGAIAAYGLVGEGLVRALGPGSEPWLLSNRLAAWLMGGHRIVEYPESCGFGPCVPEITTLTTLDGGVYLAALLVAGLAGSYLLFRRRDVT